LLRAVLAAVMPLAVSACGAAQVDRAAQERQEDAEFAGQAYPAPAPADAGRPQVAVPPTPAAARMARLPPPPPADPQLAQEMRNAALRDQHYEQLLRGYFGLVEALYREFGAQRGAEGSYDSLPLLRVHLELEPAMRGMVSRAAALDARLSEMAAQMGLAIKGPEEASGDADRDLPMGLGAKAPARNQSRAARLGRMVAFSRCAGDDLKARLEHSDRLGQLRKAGKTDDDLRSDPPPPVQMARDMGLMMRTLQCSKQASQLMQDR
jgi:hypothetical protein